MKRFAAVAVVFVTLSYMPARAASEAVVYSFQGPPNGGQPEAGLIDVNGTLYGTTYGGGDPADDGTVFSVTPTGTEHVLHMFGGGNDGVGPTAALVNVNGTLFGTTVSGGNYGCQANGCGVVFSISPAGIETVVHTFAGADGSFPMSGLINVGGLLYGTTSGGGAYGLGAVFKMTTAGKLKVIYSFKGGADGEYPAATLINVNGTLYGTTLGGGGNLGPNCSGGAISGCGTVFSLTKSGVEKVVYAFQGGSDGSQPQAGLLDLGGTLYGTTRAGGQVGCGYYQDQSCGTVFALSSGGSEKVLHVFGSGSDGFAPVAGLIKFGNLLWGTCPDGEQGVSSGGTVYSITTAGVENVVHAFQAQGDGYGPLAGLLNVHGTLYGTTLEGGAKIVGTVFKITP